MTTRYYKKQKLDKSDDDNEKEQPQQNKDEDEDEDEESEEIDITNLEKYTVVQLKDIATKEYSVSYKSNIKKNDLIEQIKAAHKRKQDTILKKEYLDNINSFNKEIVEFTIKDGIEQLEWSFWKVFRNKFIYKRIMSFMDTHLSIEYDSIINVSKMLKYSKTSILRDKVIRNQYLVFDGLKDFFQIYKSFKQDNDQDRLFYKQFFKHYGKYIPRYIEYDGNGEFNESEQINDIIETKCLPALQILVQEYQYKPTQINLLYAINYGVLGFIKFILQQQQQAPEDEEEADDFIIHLLLCKPQPDLVSNFFKSLDYLQNEKIIDFTSTTNITKLILYEIIKDIEINVTISLGSLISICKLILLTSRSHHSKMKIKEIQSFTNDSLTKQELKNQIHDKSNQNQDKREFIIKLLNIYHSYISQQWSIELKLYFGINQEEEDYDFGKLNENCIFPYIGTTNINSLNLKLSFQFGNFKLFKYCRSSSGNAGDDGGRTLPDFFKEKLFLFSHCSNKREIQIQFINSMISDIKSIENFDNNFKTIEPTDFMYLLVEYNDLELIKYFILELGTTTPLNYNISPYYINEFIKSIQVLDYMFVNHYQFFNNSVGILRFKNVELLKHYEQIFKNKMVIQNSGGIDEESIITKDDIIINIANFYSIESIEILYHIIENSLFYKFGSTSIYFMYVEICSHRHILVPRKLEMLKLIFLNFQYKKSSFNYSYFQFMPTNGYYSNSIFKKFLDWLYINHSDHLDTRNFNNINSSGNGNNNNNSIQLQPPLIYNIGRYNEIQFNLTPVEVICKCNFETEQDINLLDHVLTKFSTTAFGEVLGSNKIYNKILIVSAQQGRLKVFEHIFNNFGWLFKIKTKKNQIGTNVEIAGSNSLPSSPLFSIKELKLLLFKSLLYNHLELSEFLIQILPTITKKEFDLNCGTISKEYFKNKYI